MKFSLRYASDLYFTTEGDRIGVEYTQLINNQKILDNFKKFVDGFSPPRVFCVPKKFIHYLGQDYVECSDFYINSYGYKLDASISYNLNECLNKVVNALTNTDYDIHIFSITSTVVGVGMNEIIYEWTMLYAMKERSIDEDS